MGPHPRGDVLDGGPGAAAGRGDVGLQAGEDRDGAPVDVGRTTDRKSVGIRKIGRASCRERV